MTLRLTTPIVFDVAGALRALLGRKDAPAPPPAPESVHYLTGIDQEIRDLREGCIRYAGTPSEPLIRLALAEARHERVCLIEARSAADRTPTPTPEPLCPARQLLEDLR